MQLHIGSKHLAADIAVALDVSGREHLVIAAKATWSIPEPGQRPRPLPPEPLVMADAFYGEPGESAMRYGADMARFKPRCDVLFDACAHSPEGQPVHELLAGFEVGELKKTLRVHGPRQWQRAAGGLAGYRLSRGEAFTRMPLHHGLAFGGTRWYEQGKEKLCEANLHNPAGLGFAGAQTKTQMHQQPAPQLEHPQQSVKQPDDRVEPMALSAIGRHWLPRRRHAGTYDAAWQRDVFPLLPLDFDEQFHQCAPADQQMAYPQGGEAVRLLRLLPGRPDVQFALPPLPMQMKVLRKDYSQASPAALVDTLFFETEQQRFSAVWRASVPLRRNLQEVAEVAVGPVDPLWWRERTMGRPGVGCRGCNPQPGELAASVQEIEDST
jgi:hypothetical protein